MIYDEFNFVINSSYEFNFVNIDNGKNFKLFNLVS